MHTFWMKDMRHEFQMYPPTIVLAETSSSDSPFPLCLIRIVIVPTDAITSTCTTKWTLWSKSSGPCLFSNSPHLSCGVSDILLCSKADVICNVDIGHHTFVGTETSICDSVIGAHCVIGSNVKIRDSYIWDNVTIEDNCTIEKSIIASKVLIRKGAIIAEGAIISSGVEIDENVHLKPYTNLINDEDTIVNREAVGEKGKGNFFEQEVNSDDSECEDIDIWNKSPRNIPEDASSVSTNFSDSTDNSCESENYDGDEFTCRHSLVYLCNFAY